MRRAQRVVVMTDGPAEDGEHGIPDELLAGSVERFDRLAHGGQGGVDP